MTWSPELTSVICIIHKKNVLRIQDLRELLSHDVFVPLGSADGHHRKFSWAAVQAELCDIVAELVLVGHGKVQLLALIQEALGHLHDPETRSHPVTLKLQMASSQWAAWLHKHPPVPPVVGAFGVLVIVNVVVSHQEFFSFELVFVIVRHVRTHSKTGSERERLINLQINLVSDGCVRTLI